MATVISTHGLTPFGVLVEGTGMSRRRVQRALDELRFCGLVHAAHPWAPGDDVPRVWVLAHGIDAVYRNEARRSI